MLQTCHQTRRGGVLIAVLLALCLVAPSANAKKKRKRGARNSKRVVALFIVAKNKPNPKIYGTLAAELTKAPKQIADLKVLWGKALKKAIKKKPDVAIAKCGSNIKCIAKLGKQAKAEQVLYARVTPAGKGVKAQFLVVNVATQTVDKRVEMEVATIGNVKPVLAAKLDELFATGVAIAAASTDEEELSLDMILGGGEELPFDTGGEMAVADATPASSEAEIPLSALGIGESSGSESLAGLDPESNDTPIMDDPALTSGLDSEGSHEIAALDMDAGHAHAGTSSSASGKGGVGGLTYAGIGVAGLGAIGIGLGGMFGIQSKSKRDEIKYGAGGTNQVEAEGINGDANDLAGRANLLFGIGAGAVVVGGALIAIDMMMLGGGNEATTSVSVGEGSASIRLGWRW